jgi:hypothetical protein
MFLDCCHVCKTCTFHDALQAGKQKEVHRAPLIWRLWVPDQGSTVGGLLSALQAGKQKEVYRTPLIWRLWAPDQGSTVGGSLSPPEKHHERRMFCRHCGNPRMCDSGSAIDA